MSNLVIYCYPESPKVFKALIAAKYNGAEIAYPPFAFGTANKTPEFLAKNPLGKVPVLDTPTGAVFESNAILRYVGHLNGDKASLCGRTAVESAQVDQWIDFASNEVEVNEIAWLAPIYGYLPFNQKNQDRAIENLKATLAVLNRHLALRTFLVGHRVTLADIGVALGLLRLYKDVFDADFRAPFVNVNRWFLTCVNQPEFHAVLGDVVLCKERKQAPKPEKAEKAPKAEKAEKKEAAPKAEKAEKKEAAPKAEKKEAAPPADDADEDDVPKEKKKRSALEDLPPSTMVLDAWKRQYSNTDTRAEALPWLWENFDFNGYCWFRSTYKYPEELGPLFKTCNLVGGLLQRCEELRKYAFGSVLILGTKDQHNIDGVWMLRGNAIPAEFIDVPDYESYSFAKLDPQNNPADRELVNDFLAWDKPIEGKEIQDGKVFK